MTAGEGWEIARVLEKAAEAEDKRVIMKQQSEFLNRESPLSSNTCSEVHQKSNKSLQDMHVQEGEEGSCCTVALEKSGDAGECDAAFHLPAAQPYKSLLGISPSHR